MAHVALTVTSLGHPHYTPLPMWLMWYKQCRRWAIHITLLYPCGSCGSNSVVAGSSTLHSSTHVAHVALTVTSLGHPHYIPLPMWLMWHKQCRRCAIHLTLLYPCGSCGSNSVVAGPSTLHSSTHVAQIVSSLGHPPYTPLPMWLK